MILIMYLMLVFRKTVKEYTSSSLTHITEPEHLSMDGDSAPVPFNFVKCLTLSSMNKP